jgi:hypothetical protein
MRITFFDSLRDLARRSSTSLGELRVIAPAREESIPQRGLVYRLRHWPELPERMRTADVLRVLSVMSSRPVNREWLLRHLKMKPAGVDAFVEKLVQQDDLEVVDTSKYRTAT